MVPRPRRLSRPGFSSLSSAKRVSTAHFLILFSVAGAYQGVGAVVAKKIAPRAVDRHLLKRRILSVLAPWARTGNAIVVHAKRGALALPFPEFRRELEGLLHSAIGSRASHP